MSSPEGDGLAAPVHIGPDIEYMTAWKWSEVEDFIIYELGLNERVPVTFLYDAGMAIVRHRLNSRFGDMHLEKSLLVLDFVLRSSAGAGAHDPTAPWKKWFYESARRDQARLIVPVGKWPADCIQDQCIPLRDPKPMRCQPAAVVASVPGFMNGAFENPRSAPCVPDGRRPEGHVDSSYKPAEHHKSLTRLPKESMIKKIVGMAKAASSRNQIKTPARPKVNFRTIFSTPLRRVNTEPSISGSITPTPQFFKAATVSQCIENSLPSHTIDAIESSEATAGSTGDVKKRLSTHSIDIIESSENVAGSTEHVENDPAALDKGDCAIKAAYKLLIDQEFTKFEHLHKPYRDRLNLIEEHEVGALIAVHKIASNDEEYQLARDHLLWMIDKLFREYFYALTKADPKHYSSASAMTVPPDYPNPVHIEKLVMDWFCGSDILYYHHTEPPACPEDLWEPAPLPEGAPAPGPPEFC